MFIVQYMMKYLARIIDILTVGTEICCSVPRLYNIRTIPGVPNEVRQSRGLCHHGDCWIIIIVVHGDCTGIPCRGMPIRRGPGVENKSGNASTPPNERRNPAGCKSGAGGPRPTPCTCWTLIYHRPTSRHPHLEPLSTDDCIRIPHQHSSLASVRGVASVRACECGRHVPSLIQNSISVGLDLAAGAP